MIVAESIAIAHLVVAEIILIGGQILHTFGVLKESENSAYPGAQFLFTLLDYPAHLVVSGMTEVFDQTLLGLVLFAQIVIAVASLFYGTVAYLIAAFFGFIRGE